MSEFKIFNEDNSFKMKFALDSTISELKQVISEKFRINNINNFFVFLEKSGFIDINPSSLNSPLSSLNSSLSKLTQPNNLFCLDITNPQSYKTFCTNKLLDENELDQTGIKIKENDLILCLPCSKYCHNIYIDKLPYQELITDKKFKCQCNQCKFDLLNLNDVNFGSNSKDDYIKKIITLINSQKEEINKFKK